MFELKMRNLALAGVAQLVEHDPVRQRSPVQFLVRTYTEVVG